MSANNSSSSLKYSSVFVAGATGVTGLEVTKALLSHSYVKVSILVRNVEKAKELIERGATVIQGDIIDISEDELTKHLESVDVIVSVLQAHDPRVMNEGQLKLLNCGKKAGVKRFLPSSYGINYNKVNYGECLPLDVKKKFTVELEKSGLEYVHLHTGSFAHYVTLPSFFMTFDKDSNTVTLSGDINIKLGVTTSQDIGKFAAECALRKDIVNRDVTIRGDYLTVKEMAHLLYGPNVKFNITQSLDELKKSIDERMKNLSTLQPEEFLRFIFDQIVWVVYDSANRQGYDNDLFPTIKTTPFKEYAENFNK